MAGLGDYRLGIWLLAQRDQLVFQLPHALQRTVQLVRRVRAPRVRSLRYTCHDALLGENRSSSNLKSATVLEVLQDSSNNEY